MRAYGEFLETNVRVYTVDPRGRRGTVFLTMEADRLWWVLAGVLYSPAVRGRFGLAAPAW